MSLSLLCQWFLMGSAEGNGICFVAVLITVMAYVMAEK